MTTLSLSRRIGETIIIDHDIHVTITKIQGRKVRVSISAPSDVDIIRAEFEGVWEIDDNVDEG